MKFPRFSGMISVSFLLTPSELEELFRGLGGYFVRIDKVEEKPLVSLKEVIEAYETYFATWQGPVDRSFMRSHFQLALTTSLDSIIFLPIHIAKVKEPVIMIRPHADKGLEALYPRIYQEAETGIIHNTFPPGRFANTELFQKLQRFLRHHSLPQKDSPVRLGKNVL